jgi:RHS repeat-associated protein
LASLNRAIVRKAGNLAAEYAVGARANPQCESCYVTVDQLGGARMVAYALSRVMSATNPEGGTTTYSYDSIPAIGNVPALNLTQTYTYDAVGRLSTAGEGSGSWSQSYGYTDGNRYVSANSGFSLSASTPTVASSFDSRNRLNVNNAAYDNGVANANGNQTAIGGYAYTYDAENRMVSAVLNAGATLVSSAGYVYDGAGQRVQKMTCWSSVPCTPSSSDATITTYVYDAFGNLAQEYGAYLNAWCGTPTCYLTQDQIGSTRMVTDANGLVGTRYDFLPFGEEVPAGTGGRTQSMGYNGWEDNSNPKFAGQMRDPESARDLMGLRYYSPQEGRFVSVDPGNAGADNGTPETWNGYSYVVNNPLSYTDPSGLGIPDWLKDLFGIGDNDDNTQSAGNGLQTLGQPPAPVFYANGWCYGCLPTGGWFDGGWVGNGAVLGSNVYDISTIFFAQAVGHAPPPPRTPPKISFKKEFLPSNVKSALPIRPAFTLHLRSISTKLYRQGELEAGIRKPRTPRSDNTGPSISSALGIAREIQHSTQAIRLFPTSASVHIFMARDSANGWRAP